MNLAVDKQHLPNAVILGSALVVLAIILAIYLDDRSDLASQQNANVQNLADGKSILERQSRLRHLLSGASFNSDPSTVEDQLLHQLHDWEQQTGVSNASFQRSIALQEHGFTVLTVQISASGPMQSVAGLLYRMETAPIPLRVENIEMRPLTDTGEDLSIILDVSVPCRAVKSPEPHVTAGADLEGSNG
jgi:hypothetical protein